MTKEELLNNDLPIVTEYDDRYEKASITEVMRMVENNDPAAIYEAAARYYFGEDDVKQDKLKGLELYQYLLKFQRNTRAMYRIGYAYRREGYKEGYEKDGISYYEAAYELGNTMAAIQLGIEYEYGEVIEKNWDKALGYYNFALLSGDENANYHIARLYQKKDMHIEAIEYYRKAEEMGDLDAMLELGLYYAEGKYIEKDLKKAFELYKKAAENEDNIEAAFYLGRAYYYGAGTEENDKLAFELLKKVSENGYNAANCMLATLYMTGVKKSVEKNNDIAFEYLSNVSKSDESRALYLKGRIFLEKKDIEEAKKCLQEASDLGEEEAKTLLENILMKPKSLEEVAEEGSDPYAMIQYAAHVFGNKEKGGIHKSKELLERAEQLYPDNLDVKLELARLLFVFGHIRIQIGANDDVDNIFNRCLFLLDYLKQRKFKLDECRKIEVDVCFEYGELLWKKDNDKQALDMLERTELRKYPYASVIISNIHSRHSAFQRMTLGDVDKLKQALATDSWRCEAEKATAYYMLSILHAHGVLNVLEPNEEYAYECIKKCAELDPELAKDELKKYTVGFWGSVKYRR